MAVSIFTLIERSNRNMKGVDAKVKALAIELVKRAYHSGILVQITSGYRSAAEQNRLYNQGRTTPGSIVTNARAGQSIHNYGLAIDYALLTSGGVMHWDISRDMNQNQARDWFEVAAIGKQLGFQWGGDWKSFTDYPHLDMQRGLSLSQLANGKRPSVPSVPKRGYLGAGDTGADVTAAQKNLTKVGYKTTIDGAYGDGTTAAVKAFQKARKITADGLYGAGTVSEMNKALKGTPAPAPKPPAKNKPTPAPKPKEEDDILNLSGAERKEIAAGFKKAKDAGIFSSDTHQKEIIDGTMTASRLAYLTNVIAIAGINGGKRLKV